jgi:threonine/homoserine/homoserine lactone efflux protein
MLLGGLFASLLVRVLPEVVQVFSYAGAAYILYLAYRVLHVDYALSGQSPILLGYKDGLLLQLFNPKVLVLALTVYTTFLGTMDRNISSLFFECSLPYNNEFLCNLLMGIFRNHVCTSPNFAESKKNG